MKTVEKIERKLPVLKARKRVAAYARVSMESERMQHSLSAQVSYYSALIQKNPEWEYAGVFADYGISGTGTKKRDEFNSMLAECEAGNIDIILTKSIQRFARNTVDLLNTVRHLKELGIEVRFEKENINSLSGDGELMLSILASFAQEESRSISENVKWGTIKRFRQGIPNGKFSILGYEWQDDRLVIIPEEAEIIRWIYVEYMKGASRIEIGRALMDRGIYTRQGKPWVDSNVKVTPTLTEDEIKGLFLRAANQVIDQKEQFIAIYEQVLSRSLDTTALESELSDLEAEINIAAELIEECIKENAHIALDQDEYQKRYDALVIRFDKAKARHTEVTDLITERMARKHLIETYLKNLRSREPLTEFRETYWLAMVDYIIFHSKKDIRVTFKDGTEIKA